MSNDTTTTSDRFIRLTRSSDGAAMLIRASTIDAVYTVVANDRSFPWSTASNAQITTVRESVDEIARMLAGEASP